jgi:hypothetical protein
VSDEEPNVEDDTSAEFTGRSHGIGRPRRVDSEQLLRFLQEDLAVYDSQNNKIGVVRNVYRPAGPDEPFYVEVSTQFRESGQTQLSATAVRTPVLFIPSDYLRLSDDQLELTVERHQIDLMQWGQRPPGIQD